MIIDVIVLNNRPVLKTSTFKIKKNIIAQVGDINAFTDDVLVRVDWVFQVL